MSVLTDAGIPAEVLGQDLVDVRPLNQEGGFSSLFRAHKQGLDVDVVIKRVKSQFKGKMDEGSEARILTGLRHQYLPRIYDFKRASDGYCYTIMELVPGCTLREYVQAHGALDQKQTLAWTLQLCQVTEYMHGRSPAIIHSDLKPENVMITPDGDICVIDFNASLVAKEEEMEAIGASSGYAAPEQYNFAPELFPADSPLRALAQAAAGFGHVTTRTDLYAIGALAYYMITGYDPLVWAQGVVPLERYDIQLGDPFRQVIERAMTPDPKDRFASASEMLRALNRLEKMDKRYKRWAASCWAAAGLWSLALAGSLLCAALGWRGMQQDTRTEYINLVQQAQTLMEQMQYADSEQLLMQAVQLEPKATEAYARLGGLLFRTGQYQQAVDLLSGQTFEPDPGMSEEQFRQAQAEVQYVLGSCHYQLEEYTDALQAYQNAVYLDGTQLAYQRDLAVAWARTGEPELARETVEQLRGQGCPEADLAMVSGEIEFAYGNYEAALEQLSLAASRSEDDTVVSRASQQAARCCQQLGDAWLGQEIDLLTAACSRLGAAGNSLQLQMLSEAYLRRGAAGGEGWQQDYEQALACLQQLLDRGYATFAVRQNAAVVLQYLDRYDEAEQQLLALEQDYPGDYRVYMRLALLYADREGAKPTEQRDYTAMGAAWRQAQQLYASASVQDAEMLRLEELVNQLIAAGWALE